MARRIGERGNKRKAKDRPRYDTGTPELLRKRLEALGPQRSGWPVPDTAFAESPIGCLLFQGLLHPEYDRAKRMYDAGVTFAGWWTLVHPKTHAQGTLGQFAPKEGSGAEIDTTEAEANLSAASALLKRERQVFDAVVNTCVYQRYDGRALGKLRTGLGWLMEWQREARRAA